MVRSRRLVTPTLFVMAVGMMAVVFLAAPAVLAQEDGSDDAERVSVVGTVAEAQWDDVTGEATAVAIESEEGPIYLIEAGGYAAKLMDLVGERVQVEGYVTEHDNGDLSVFAEGYTVLR